MRATVGHQLVLALVAGAILFVNLGGGTLFDEDEPKNAECAREMAAAGNWVVPTFNDELRTDKPILLYWLMIAAYAVLGVGELAARFWSAALGIGTVLATYHLGRILFRPGVGLWAGLAMSSALMFDVVARAATPDSTLIFFVTLGFVLYARGAAQNWKSSDLPSAELSRFTPQSTWAWIGVYSAWAFAVLAKGPVGIVLPVAILGLFLLCATRPAVLTPWPALWRARGRWTAIELARLLAPLRVGRAALALRPLVCLGVLAVVALPWYVAVGLQTDGAWLAGFLGKHNVGRFVGTMENHRGPIVYYLIAILIGFFPWSVFLTPSLVTLARRWRAAEVGRGPALFITCWAGLWIGFFSLAGTKLPNYVLPAYPALALIVGLFLDAWIRDPALVARRLIEPSLATLGIAGVGLIVGLGVVAYLFLPGDWPIALVGLVPAAGGLASVLAYRRGDARRAMTAFAAAAVAMCVLAFGWVAPRASLHQNARPLVAAARDAQGREPRLATFDYWLPSLVFYGRAPVARLGKPADVQAFFAADPRACLVTKPEHVETLRPHLPPDAVVVARQRRFLRRGEIVLVARSTLQAAAESNAPRR